MALRLVAILESGAMAEPVGELSEFVAGVVDATVALYGRSGFTQPWVGYLGIEEGEIVGVGGFNGPPRDGEAEIAYGTVPGNEGRGIATGVARALVAIVERSDAPRPIAIAHTLPHDGPSPAILRKLGFVCLGECVVPEDGVVWKWRRPSLIACAEAGDADGVRRCLDRGTPVDTIDNGRFNETALQVAARAGHAEVIAVLLDAGANVNHIDHDGFSPVTSAARAGKWEVVLALAERCADFSVVDGYGKSGIDYLRRCRSTRRRAAIESALAERSAPKI